MSRTHVQLLVLSALLLWPVFPSAQSLPAPVLDVSVTGQTVAGSWNAVTGATGYRLEAGVTPAVMLYGFEVGPQTTFSIAAPQGVYYLRVRARSASGLGTPSAVVTASVLSSQGPPPPVTNVAANVTGSTVTINALLPQGLLTGLLLVGGMSPGASQFVRPLTVAAQNILSNVPAGSYYARLLAVSPGGTSAPSNEVNIVVTALPACTAPSAPVVTAQVSGTAVVLSWGAVAGATGYRVVAATTSAGAPISTQAVGPQSTGVSNPNVPVGTYYVTVSALSSCSADATSAETVVTVTPGPAGSNRTPNPPAGQRLPLPNRESVVQEVARQYPADLRASCVSSGGNNTWLYRLVQRLRQEDTRWGLNWKRGRINDMSQDVVTYNWGSENDEGTRNIYVLDIIAGHCGPSPSPAWFDVTGAGGADAIWTLQPYTQAGFR